MKALAIAGLAAALLVAAATIGPAAMGGTGTGAGWNDTGADGHSALVERLSAEAAVRVLTGSVNAIPSGAGDGDILFLFPDHRAAAPAELRRVQEFVTSGGTVVMAFDSGHANEWVVGLGAVSRGQPALLAPGAKRDCVEVEVRVQASHLLCLPSPAALPDLDLAPGIAGGFLQVADARDEVFLDLDGDGRLGMGDQGPERFPFAAAWQLGRGTVWVIADGDLWRNGVATTEAGHADFAAELVQGAGVVYIDSIASPRTGLDQMAVPLYRAWGAVTPNDSAALALLLVATFAAVAAVPRAARWSPHTWHAAEDAELEAKAVRLIAESMPHPSQGRRRT